MKAVESVGSGVFKLDFDGESLTISSSKLNESYSEVLEFGEKLWAAYGEEATVEWSGPLHKFFKKDQLLTFYVLDDAPLVIIADDRRLVKAPHQGV